MDRATPENEDKSHLRFVLGEMLGNLIIVTKDQAECRKEIHGISVGEMLGNYLDFFEKSDENTITSYGQNFGMGSHEFKDKFMAMYNRTIDRQPEIMI